jgi:hypothetical protein
MRRALPILLVIPVMGFTCEYFATVTVPATDSGAPTAATRYWIDGEEHLAIWPVSETFSDPSVAIAVFPAIYDSGGARRLEVGQHVEVRCHDDDADPELGQITNIAFFTKVATQNGSVGSKVSNGLYLAGDVTDLPDYAWYCNAGFDLTRVTYTWSIFGRDFHNNAVSMPGGEIVYVP